MKIKEVNSETFNLEQVLFDSGLPQVLGTQGKVFSFWRVFLKRLLREMSWILSTLLIGKKKGRD